MILTARSFAAKNHYEIDVDRDFAAFGAAKIAAAVSQGLAISGADSHGHERCRGWPHKSHRTVHGRCRGCGSALLYGYVHVAALGAVLVQAAFSLFDIQALTTFYQLDRQALTSPPSSS
jgi:MFS superfamily sulfate permease-like transporter